MADSILIDDCEASWTGGTINMAVSQGTGAYKQVGTYSARVDVADGASANDLMMYKNVSSLDLSGQRHFLFYVYSTVALDAWDVQFGYDADSNMASPVEWINIPAMSADTWYRFVLTIPAALTLRANVDSVGFRMHIDKGGFTFFADDIRAFCGYTLPQIVTDLGTFSIFVGSTIPDLTAPTVNTICDIGDLTERLDFIPGNIDLATLSISFEDDYTVHSGGFWNEVLAGDVDIQILLNEGVGNTFVFWGAVKRDESKFSEISLVGGVATREGTLVLVSLLAKMRDVTFESLSNHLLDQVAYVQNTGDDERYVRVADIFCAAIEQAFSQEYQATDCYVTLEGGTDLAFQESGADHTFMELYVSFMSYSGPGWSFNTFFTWGTTGFSANYGNPWDLCKDLARQFGFVPHHVYDLATSRHKIELVQRGRALSATITLQSPLNSTYSPYNPMGTERIRVFRRKDETHQHWAHDGATGEGAPPGELNFDTEMPCLYVLNAGGTVNEYEKLLHVVGNPASLVTYFDGVKVYSYEDGSTTLYNSGNFILQHALLDYYLARYRRSEQKSFHRSYDTMVVTNNTSGLVSHTGVSLMRETVIGGVNYGITEYTKNFTTGELELTLVDT